MAKQKKMTQDQIDKELIKEMRALTKEVKNLKELEFVKIFKRPWKYLWFMFLKGLMVGFGSILGASVLLSLFIAFLTQISFVPLIGDVVQDVINQIEVAKPDIQTNDNTEVIDQNNQTVEENLPKTVEQNQ